MTKFSKAIFEPLINKTFTLQKRDGQTITVKLTGITSRDISPLFESFTLNFEPPAGEAALEDNSYMMQAEGFGPTPIFISATHAGTPDPTAYYYEAVFNVFKET